jgi:hypothetical protein
LKTAVKKSLHDLSRAINGDSKTDPIIMFSIQIYPQEMHLSYLPNMINLTQNVNHLAKDIINSIHTVGRIRAQVFDTVSVNSNLDRLQEGDTELKSSEETTLVVEEKYRKPYHEIISEDGEVLRTVVQV